MKVRAREAATTAEGQSMCPAWWVPSSFPAPSPSVLAASCSHRLGFFSGAPEMSRFIHICLGDVASHLCPADGLQALVIAEWLSRAWPP